MTKKLLIPLAATALSSLLLLTSLDNRIFDLYLRALPSLTEDPSVLLIRIDDSSLENVGLFPWPRDIMADAIVFLKEMGADTVSFDLSYLDSSPVGVDLDYLNNELPLSLDRSFSYLDDMVSQVMDGFAYEIIASSEADAYKDQMLGINRQVRENINMSLSKVTIDRDDYFGKALNFFDDSYLTLTMVTSGDMGEGQVFDMAPYRPEWIRENIALARISSAKDQLTPEVLGIIPTISKLQDQAMGAGFVNAPVDDDGFRRRLHLLYKYGGDYYGQFIFIPLLEKLGSPDIRVDNRRIILENALVKGEKKDLTIPRSHDGSVLIKWPKKQFIDYRNLTAWDLIVANELEEILFENLETMAASGFFMFWDQESSPLELYTQADYIRETLLAEEPSEGLDMATYRSYRKAFFEGADLFLNGPYEKNILSSLDNPADELITYIRTSFDETRKQLTDLQKVRDRVSRAAEGAFCIVGVDATSMTDQGMTTFQEVYPNVGIHATLSHMILSGEFLDDTAPAFSLVLAVVLSLLLAQILARLDTNHMILAGMAALLVTVLLLLGFFMITSTYVGTAVPISSMTITFISLSIMTYFQTVREKSFLRNAFSRYLSPEVISEIVDDPTKLNLGGEKREMTAIFTDIRGFSSFSEDKDPADLVKLLNLYLSRMSDIILKNRGTIDKYEGDAIIAFFGAPIKRDDHAAMACRTVVEMKKAEVELNRQILETGLNDKPLFTRIGLNTGEMIVGNMGTASKMDYTIMGNAVNLAARLEGVNKHYDTKGILISQHTKDRIGPEFLCRRLDRVRVVGINHPIRLYELLDCVEEGSEGDLSYPKSWDKAMDLYDKGEFSDAEDIFRSLCDEDSGDGVAKTFLKRCEEFVINPPTDWDGIQTLDKK